VQTQLVDSRVSQHSGNPRVNVRMQFLFETKLFHTYVRRSYHRESEENLSALNSRDMKYRHFAPYESEKLDYRKS